MKAEGLFSGRLQALKNATDLIDEANLLFASGRYARAFFLAHIATEELGKYALLITSAIRAVDGSLSWDEFRQNYRSHKTKTRQLISFENFYHVLNKRGDHLLLSSEDKHYATLQEEVKMLSLYCDFDEEGFTLPSEQIPASIADTALKLVQSRLEMVAAFEEQVASVYPFENLTKEHIDRFQRQVFGDAGDPDGRP